MRTRADIFEPAIHTAEDWLASVARQFDTDDKRFAYRALRAWLHGIRDELPVHGCAHFAAQLPELLRGLYYDGWAPSRVPMPHDLDAFIQRFAREAQVRPAEVRRVASTVTTALHEHLAGAELASVLEQLPAPLRELLWVSPAIVNEPREARLEQRITRLEEQLRLLTDAVSELVHGLEHTPLEEPTNTHAAQAAHRAHQILLTTQP